MTEFLVIFLQCVSYESFFTGDVEVVYLNIFVLPN